MALNNGIITLSLAASGSATIYIPAGALTIQSSASAPIMMYKGNNAVGMAFPIQTNGGKNPFTIENFVGGQYTFVESTGGATATIAFWYQGHLEESGSSE